MTPFRYERPTDLRQALDAGRGAEVRFLAGGTTLVDLMKLGVETPTKLIDISRLDGLGRVRVEGGTLWIGALARMGDVAADDQVIRDWPAVSESLWLAASAQLRNMATIGGNLLQRTRCPYFRDADGYANCNKRLPDSGCAALDGDHRGHAVFGGSASCIAVSPGDLPVALAAFDASIWAEGPEGRRSIPVDSFFLEPGQTPAAENALRAGELIVEVSVPASAAAQRSAYLKVRDRASYEFAAASAAVGLDIAGGIIRDARVALGGVATRPWRVRAAERFLAGRRLDETIAREAGALAVQDARPLRDNAHKVELAQRTVARALMAVGGMS